MELMQELLKMPFRFVSGHRHVAPMICSAHSHSSFEIVYHPSGRGTTLVQASRSVEFSQGSVVIYAPDTTHDQTMAETGMDVFLQIDAEAPLPQGMPDCWYITESLDSHLLQELYLLSDIHPSRSALQQRILDHRAAAVILALFQLDAMRCLRINNPLDYYAERADQYLRANYRTIDHFDEISKHLCISSSYLRHLFKRRFGTNISHTLTMLRIERSLDLLRNPEMTLATIARDCGIANERYFITIFKEIMGCTPGQYRNKILMATVDHPTKSGEVWQQPSFPE